MQNIEQNASLQILLTGAGSIGRRHAQNLRTMLPNANYSVVCRSEDSRAWANAFGAQIKLSVDDALQSKVDLAVISSGSVRHADELMKIMPHVQALYVEKPLLTDSTALIALKSLLANGWKKASVVGCNLRYLGAIEKLHQAITAGMVGRVVHASLRVGQWLPDWRASRDWRAGYSAHRDQGGGVIFDLVHELDSAIRLFGPIANGQAAAASLSSLAIDADDSAAIILQMQSGLPVQIGLDYVSRQPIREYFVVGDQASLRLDILGRQLQLINATETRLLHTVEADWDVASTYTLAMADLVRAWHSGTPSCYGLLQALHTTEWMLKLEKNAWRTQASTLKNPSV